jgi:hypothetical protein
VSTDTAAATESASGAPVVLSPTPEAAAGPAPPREFMVRRVRYREGVTPPDGYELRQRPIKGLVIGGGITLGVFYGMGVSDMDAVHEGGAAMWMFLPVLGPAVAAAHFAHCANQAATPEEEYDCDNSSTTAGAYAFLQAVGAGLIAGGYLGRRKWWVRSDHAIRLAPWQTRHAHGFSVEGRF